MVQNKHFLQDVTNTDVQICTRVFDLMSSPQTNPYYVKPRLADHQFGIKHYAGEVGFCPVCVCVCVLVLVRDVCSLSFILQIPQTLSSFSRPPSLLCFCLPPDLPCAGFI